MWLANQSEIKQNTNLWRWVGRRVLPLPVWDVNAFFWGLPDTNLKWRTTVGRTHALSWVNPLSPNPMDSKQMDVIHLTPTVPATDSRLKQKQSGHLCWFSSKPVTTLNLSRLATSEAATPRTSVILRTVITGRSFLLKMVCPSTCDSNLNESRVSKRSSNGLLSKGKKTLLKAQETLVWSGISDYVRNAIKLCDVCQKYKPTQQKEPLIPHDNTLAKAILNRKISLKPWSKS